MHFTEMYKSNRITVDSITDNAIPELDYINQASLGDYMRFLPDGTLLFNKSAFGLDQTIPLGTDERLPHEKVLGRLKASADGEFLELTLNTHYPVERKVREDGVLIGTLTFSFHPNEIVKWLKSDGFFDAFKDEDMAYLTGYEGNIDPDGDDRVPEVINGLTTGTYLVRGEYEGDLEALIKSPDSNLFGPFEGEGQLDKQIEMLAVERYEQGGKLPYQVNVEDGAVISSEIANVPTFPELKCSECEN